MPGKSRSGGLKPPVYIDTDHGLRKLAQNLLSQPAIAMDTESNPLFVYREKLCLIQISTKTRDYLIDPLAGLDVGLLVPVLADPGVLKIFHDAEFDVLMLKKTLPVEISGIFDTKIVATSLGMENVGLAALLKELFDVTLDKRYQRSDWGKRPLSQGQLDYARYDTHFLLPLANLLRDRLQGAGELNVLEVAAECRRVEALVPEARKFKPDEFIRIKGSDDLDPVGRRVLRELFAMRHEIAEEEDRPPFKVLPNDMLLRLAKGRPKTMESLKRSRILSVKLRERYGEDVLATIRQGLDLKGIQAGEVTRPKKGPDALGEEQRVIYEALRVWRKKMATMRKTDASLVLSRSTMLTLCRLRAKPKDLVGLRDCGLLEPWRVEYYGEGILSAITSPGSGRRRRRQGKTPRNP